MSQQMSYTNQQRGFAGQRIGLQHRAQTYVNDRGSERQTDDVSFAAVNSQAYTFTVNGITVTYTSDATATLAEIRDGLITAFRALPELEGIAYANPSGNNVRITSAVPGTATTVTNVANTTVTPVQANVAQESIKFGRGVAKRTGTGTNDLSARAMFAPTAKVMQVTATAATNAKVYSFVIFIPRTGLTYLIDYLSDGSATTAEISAGLTARVNALDVPVTAADTTDELTLTSDVPGEDFQIQEADSQLTVATLTANVNPKVLGVVERVHQDTSTSAADDAVKPLTPMTVIEDGDVLVEVEGAVAFDDQAYCRHTASGANTGIGAWRNDADSNNAVIVTGAKFRSSTTGKGFAVLRLNKI